MPVRVTSVVAGSTCRNGLVVGPIHGRQADDHTAGAIARYGPGHSRVGHDPTRDGADKPGVPPGPRPT